MASDQPSEFDTQWADLPIVCPYCGNHGEPRGRWTINGWTPFRLIEEVVRSWPFSASLADGKLSLVADAANDDVDWENGANLRFECVQCFGQFPLPEGASVDFE